MATWVTTVTTAEGVIAMVLATDKAASQVNTLLTLVSTLKTSHLPTIQVNITMEILSLRRVLLVATTSIRAIIPI